jgi:hypothetical protein
MSDDPDSVNPVGNAARAGGQAKGGIDPQPGDPDTPLAARKRQAQSHEAHRAAGHGDDRGGDAL